MTGTTTSADREDEMSESRVEAAHRITLERLSNRAVEVADLQAENAKLRERMVALKGALEAVRKLRCKHCTNPNMVDRASNGNYWHWEIGGTGDAPFCTATEERRALDPNCLAPGIAVALSEAAT